MKIFFSLLFLFYFIFCVHSIPEEIIDLDNIYEEIKSRHYLWENIFIEYNFQIDYEDILKMKRTYDRFGVFYIYRTLIFEKNINTENEYRFHVSKNMSGVQYFFVITFKYINGMFLYHKHEFQIIDQFFIF